MATKKARVGKKVRFEVFKRDSFTCQYCGQQAPDVILHVDHIEPLSKNGSGEIMNLITACSDCNLGKGATEISDTSSVKLQKKQLDELQQRREQIEMMFEWKKSLLSNSDYELQKVVEFWNEIIGVYGYNLSEYGEQQVKKMLAKHNFETIIDAMIVVKEKYLITQEDINDAFKKILAIANSSIQEKKYPGWSKMYYINGILKNRFHINQYKAGLLLGLMQKYIKLGGDMQELQDLAIAVSAVGAFIEHLQEFNDVNKNND